MVEFNRRRLIFYLHDECVNAPLLVIMPFRDAYLNLDDGVEEARSCFLLEATAVAKRITLRCKT